ncbi:hypothetical protein BU15DRAFT_63884 [Melanogaster broomeanus]|nr:hypothetical protein BU15DRAFT_63884 [Melanogaster broomeanus]
MCVLEVRGWPVWGAGAGYLGHSAGKWFVRDVGGLIAAPVARPGRKLPFMERAAFWSTSDSFEAGLSKALAALRECECGLSKALAAFWERSWSVRGVGGLIAAPVARPGRKQPIGVWATLLEREWSVRGIGGLIGAPVACPRRSWPFGSVNGPFEALMWPVQGVSSRSWRGRPFEARVTRLRRWWSDRGASGLSKVLAAFWECECDLSKALAAFWERECGLSKALAAFRECECDLSKVLTAFWEREWSVRCVGGLIGVPVACPGREQPFGVWATLLEREWSVRGIGGLIGAPVACPGRERPFWSATGRERPFGVWVAFWSASGLFEVLVVRSGSQWPVQSRQWPARGVDGQFEAPMACPKSFGGREDFEWEWSTVTCLRRTVTRAVSACRQLSAPVEGLSAPVSSAGFCEA